jgi:hypothetical protein
LTLSIKPARRTVDSAGQDTTEESPESSPQSTYVVVIERRGTVVRATLSRDNASTNSFASERDAGAQATPAMRRTAVSWQIERVGRITGDNSD